MTLNAVADVPGRLAEQRAAVVVDRAAALDEDRREVDEVQVRALFLEVVEADDPVERIAEGAAAELEFLAQLVVVPGVLRLCDHVRRVVAVAEAQRLGVAIRGDRLESDPFAYFRRDRERSAPRVEVGLRATGRVSAVRVAGEELRVEARRIRERAGRRQTLRARACNHCVVESTELARAVERGRQRRRRFLAPAARIDREVGGDRIRCKPAHGEPAGEGVGVAEIDAVRESAHEAVAVCVARTETRQDRIGQRHVGRETRAAQIVRTDLDFDRAAKLLRGGLRAHRDGAADRVAAEKSALRSAQHFDRLQIEQVHDRADRAGDVHLIQVQADAGIGVQREVDLADAANEERAGGVVAGDRRAVVRDQVRRVHAEILRGHHAAIGEALRGERRHRDRRVLQALLAFARGHHDFFECASDDFGSILSRDRARHGGERQRAADSCSKCARARNFNGHAELLRSFS